MQRMQEEGLSSAWTRRSLLTAVAAAYGVGLAPSAGASDARPAIRPFTSPVEELHAFQRIVGSTRDETIWWWHVGEIHQYLPRDGVLSVARVQTLSINRMEWLSAEHSRTHYREAGCLLTLDSDEAITQWSNPLTGKSVRATAGALEGTSFIEGPGALDYVVRSGRLVGHTEIDQTVLREVPNYWQIAGDTLTCTNVQESADMVILQAYHTDASILREREAPSVSAVKGYSVVRTAPTVAAWAHVDDPAAFAVIRGHARKGRAGDILDAAMYERLLRLHPGFFKPQVS